MFIEPSLKKFVISVDIHIIMNAGNYPFYGMRSTKKGPGFLGESHEKNDYDW